MKTQILELHPISEKKPPLQYRREGRIFSIKGCLDRGAASLLKLENIHKMLAAYISRHDQVEIRFAIDKINASSIKGLFNICKFLQKATDYEKGVKIRWQVKKEDDFMTELGIALREIYELDLHIELR